MGTRGPSTLFPPEAGPALKEADLQGRWTHEGRPACGLWVLSSTGGLGHLQWRRGMMKAFWKRRYLSRDLEKIRQKSLQGQGHGGGKERNCESFGEGWGRGGWGRRGSGIRS